MQDGVNPSTSRVGTQALCQERVLSFKNKPELKAKESLLEKE